MDGSQLRWQYQTVVIGMRHDECAHQTGGYSPRSSPGIFQLIVFIDKLHIKCLPEVLPQEMRRAALQSFPVLHHGFDGISVQSTGKTFRLALHALHYGHGHILFGKIGIHFQHQFGTFFGFFTRGMCRMSFLPQEFSSTQEQTSTHFPTENVRPLIAKNRQVTIRLNPVFISIPDNCF